MNRQGPKGIEWTDYTWNPTAGCFHRCRWPSGEKGKEITCYAKKIAESLAMEHYPDGFEHHYFYPERLNDPAELKKPSKIFVGSMADVFGAWVPDEHIEAILDMVHAYPQHIFQFLTKNPKRLLDFAPYPSNAWIGVSIPSLAQATRKKSYADAMLESLFVLHHLLTSGAGVIFLSAEPLWLDITLFITMHVFKYGRFPFDWLIIGAGSDGRRKYQPNPKWVESLLAECNAVGVPVFMKGNLQWPERREEFPSLSPNGYAVRF